MSILWIDASVAAAGDMLLAALIDAGACETEVAAGLATLGLSFSHRLETVQRGAFRAQRVIFTTEDGEADPHAGPPDSEHTMFEPADHSHDHDHSHDDHHHHRSWRDVKAVIEAAALPERAKQRALQAYGRLATAEAALHGMPVDEVELHEVGSTDAILDIVGVCLALESLDVERIVATPLPLGTGRVQGAHGAMPLPAPATLEVLRGWPVVPSPWPGEWVTPTGAALIAALATPGGPPAMTPQRIGYGAGKRNPSQVANLMRAMVGHASTSAAVGSTVVELAANLDDCTGEWIPPLFNRLLTAHALDVWCTPVTMKKGRPGMVVHALCAPEHADALALLLLRHSTSLGVRRSHHERTMLDRRHETVTTPWGPVRVKVASLDGQDWRGVPEHEDVLAISLSTDVPVPEVYAAAQAAWRQE